MERVLVVEDEDGIAELIRLLLEDEGYEVAVAHGVPEAKQLLGQHQPQVILLDYNLPPHNAGHLVQHLEEQGIRDAVAVVLMTAANHYERLAQAIGADACVGKPFDIDDLLLVVRGAFDLYELHMTPPSPMPPSPEDSA